MGHARAHVRARLADRPARLPFTHRADPRHLSHARTRGRSGWHRLDSRRADLLPAGCGCAATGHECPVMESPLPLLPRARRVRSGWLPGPYAAQRLRRIPVIGGLQRRVPRRGRPPNGTGCHALVVVPGRAGAGAPVYPVERARRRRAAAAPPRRALRSAAPAELAGHRLPEFAVDADTSTALGELLERL